jgi:hypothetical protein
MGLAAEGDVVERHPGRAVRGDLQPGQAENLELAGEGPAQALVELLSLRRGQEADRAEIDAEHRHLRRGVLAQRPENRAVPAEDKAKIGVRRQPLGDLDPLRGALVLGHLGGARDQPA